MMERAMNPIRGDVPLEIDGEIYPLRLTLGALAEIEQALGTEDFTALTARLASPSAADLLSILSALLKGGGGTMSLEDLKAKPLNLREAMTAIAAAFSAGLGTGQPRDGQAPGKSQARQSGATGATGAAQASA